MTEEKINLLLVDDRPDGLLTLTAVLGQIEEARLFTASSGFDAVKAVAERDFAAILLDVQMPGMDGFEAARRIKQVERARETPIIFVTAIHTQIAQIYHGYECGAVDYILKPFDPQILKSKVTVFLDLFAKNEKIREQAKQLLESEHHERARQLAELELENLRRYRNLADAIPHIVWKSKSDGRADYFNKFWSEYTGLSLEQSDGKGWQTMFDPADLACLLDTWARAQKTGTGFESEARITRRADKSTRWFLVRGVPEKPTHRDGETWIITCTDIHDRKKAEEELMDQAKELIRSNKELEQFAFSASHDLQEPLMKVMLFGDLLREQLGADVQQKSHDYLNRMQNASRRMSELIDNLLRYSRVTSKEEIFEPVDLNTIVQDVLSNLEMLIEKSGAEIKAAELPMVQGSRVWMHQLMQNLISNAIKFRGQATPEVEITARRRGEEWTISIKDNGIGIDPQHKEQIFSIFHRLHSRDEYPGTGIGLAIAKKIVERQNGRIWVESELGQGSTFFFTVPVASNLPIEAEKEKEGVKSHL